MIYFLENGSESRIMDPERDSERTPYGITYRTPGQHEILIVLLRCESTAGLFVYLCLIMKRLYLILILLTYSLLGFSKEYKVYGPQGELAMEVTLPDGFNEDTDKCPMVILMHGIFSSKNIVPMSCSEKFVETYTQEAELIVVEGENHMITKRLKTVVSHAVSFFASQLK